MLFAAMDWTGFVVAVVAVGVVIDRVIAYYDRKAERQRVADEKKVTDDREAAKIERDRLAAEKVEAVRIAAVGAADKVESVREQATVAARGVDEVKVTLETTTKAAAAVMKDIKQTGEANHVLLNNNMHLALAETLIGKQDAAVLARELADLKKTPEAEARAITAERHAVEARDALHRHDEKQRSVDATAASQAKS
jgi:hypothetical protein